MAQTERAGATVKSIFKGGSTARIAAFIALLTLLEVLRISQIVSSGFAFCLFMATACSLLAYVIHLHRERQRSLWEMSTFKDVLKQHFFVLETDAKGRFQTANGSYLEKIGLTIDQLRKQPLGGLAQQHDQPELAQMWASVCAGQTYSGEFTDRAADGSPVSLRVLVIPRFGKAGRLESTFTLGIDVTEQRKAERDARDAVARLEAFIKHAPAAVAMFDRNMCYVAHTERWLDDYGLPRGSLVGRSHYDVFPEIPDHWKSKHQRILAGATEKCDEERFRRTDGTQNIVRWEVRPWYLPDQSIGGMMMLTEEISERKRLENELWRLAHIDSITDLPNRRHFNTCLNIAIDEAQQNAGRFALALIDVDKLKDVNDTLGHDVGDQLLTEVAARLRAAAELGGVAARLGGDEFAMIIDDSNPEMGREHIFEVLAETMKLPIELKGISRRCSLSIGVALFPKDAREASDLMKRADLALYRAKELGRDQTAYFSIDLHESLQSRSELMEGALLGLDRDEFKLFYQPVVSSDPNQPPSFEALLRWQHPSRGLLSPGAFEEIFEDHKVAYAIGERVQSLALRQIKLWETENFPFGRVAINVISADFSRGCLANRISNQLRSLDIAPARLCVEVTEKVFLGAGVSHIGDALQRIHDLGIEVALDDFGTGYASLSHLKAYPIDRLKIDRSFVSDLESNSDNLSIVQAIVQLGRSLGLATTAEGVETMEQVALLRAMGCGSLQGYYFSRPLPADQLGAIVRSEWTIPARARPRRQRRRTS